MPGHSRLSYPMSAGGSGVAAASGACQAFRNPCDPRIPQRCEAITGGDSSGSGSMNPKQTGEWRRPRNRAIYDSTKDRLPRQIAGRASLFVLAKKARAVPYVLGLFVLVCLVGPDLIAIKDHTVDTAVPIVEFQIQHATI